MRTSISCEDVMVSVFNNSLEVLKERIDGRTSSLEGEHFTAGAWAPVTPYDYHQTPTLRAKDWNCDRRCSR